MSDWKARLYDEFGQLQIKIDKLNEFISGPAYTALPDIDRQDLSTQRVHMKAYCKVLLCRIVRQCNGV